MKKSAVTSHNLGSFPSPGTSNYGDGSGGVPKGWSSERVPPSVNSGRRYIGGSTLMPFNSGRALPSKWEDAERWISSPVSGYSVNKSSLAQPQRRPKSKSGPLGLPGVAYNPNYSPAMPVFDGGGVRNFMGPSSPFSTGVMVAEGLSLHYGAGNGGQPHPVPNEHSMERSISIPGWSDFLSESSSPNSQGIMFFTWFSGLRISCSAFTSIVPCFPGIGIITGLIMNSWSSSLRIAYGVAVKAMHMFYHIVWCISPYLNDHFPKVL